MSLVFFQFPYQYTSSQKSCPKVVISDYIKFFVEIQARVHVYLINLGFKAAKISRNSGLLFLLDTLLIIEVARIFKYELVQMVNIANSCSL